MFYLAGGGQERRESGATASSTPDSSQPPTASGSLLDVSPAQVVGCDDQGLSLLDCDDLQGKQAGS